MLFFPIENFILHHLFSIFNEKACTQMWEKSLDLVPQYIIIKTRNIAQKLRMMRIRILDPEVFFTPGSEIRSRDGKISGSGIRNKHFGSYFREPSNNFLGKKYFNSLSIPCCGSGMEKSVYSGPATLATARVLPGDAVFSEDLILLPLCRPIQPLEVSLHRPLKHILRHTLTIYKHLL